MWVERRFEGDRQARIKLDAAPWSLRKLARRGGKQAVWLAMGLWTGFTFVSYFTPARILGAEVLGFALGPWETFWILFYGLATYGNAGYLREQVCKYMCPYARFQSAMFDRDTLIVSYDPLRGEPRGSRTRGVDPASIGKGRVHRLHAVRPGLPDRHRHQERPAVRVHRLRRLHRRLQRRHGQDVVSARPDPLRHPERDGRTLVAPDDVEARRASAGSRLRRRPGDARLGVRLQPGDARADQGRRRPRPRHAGEDGRGRAHRERVPAAADERDRGHRSTSASRSKDCRARRSPPGRTSISPRPNRAGFRWSSRCGPEQASSLRPGAHPIEFRIRLVAHADAARDLRADLHEKSTFIVPR